MKKEMEEINNFELGDLEVPMKEVPINAQRKQTKKDQTKEIEENKGVPVNCLRKERIIVRYLPRVSGIWGNNPKHVLAGGMSENASRVYVVPRLASSGMYVNVLTDSEKAYLEEVMGLEYNALSIYKKTNNFWDDSNEGGIGKVRLTKQDTYLDLSIPEDYIKYKILLANKDSIAPSLQVLQDTPKATYKFVIIREGEETKTAKNSMSITMQCYKEFGKIEDDVYTLRTIIETLSGKPTASTSKLEFLQTKVNELIQLDGKMFLKVITDPMLSTKVLIKRSIEAGLIANRGNYLYLRETNQPLCEDNEEPTLNIAAKYLNSPKHQEIKFSLEAKLK
jgi:hypothetical protein